MTTIKWRGRMSRPAPACLEKCIIMHAMQTTVEQAPRGPGEPKKKGIGNGGSALYWKRAQTSLKHLFWKDPLKIGFPRFSGVFLVKSTKHRVSSIFGPFSPFPKLHETLRLLRFREVKSPVLKKLTVLSTFYFGPRPFLTNF